MSKSYQVVDKRGSLAYIGRSRDAARWHLKRTPGSRVASGPYGYFDPLHPLWRKILQTILFMR